jgi:hypothetical protein
MRRKRRMMVNQPPHREWRKRARRAAAGKRQGGKWSHCGRKGSRHRWAAEEMMEEGGRRLRCCRFVMVVVDVFDL